MSQFPPPPAHRPEPTNTVPSKTSRLAIASMILGICALPLVFFFCVGIVPAFLAVALGNNALAAIQDNPQAYTGKRMAIAGIIAGAGSLFSVALLSVLVVLGSLRQAPSRSVCAANIRWISQSMAVYAKDNSDQYPIISPNGGYAFAHTSAGTPGPDANKVIASIYAAPPAPSVTQNLWLLVLTGQVAPKQFICPFDPSHPVVATTTVAGNYQTNFNDAGKPSDFTYSYSFAYPWTTTTGAIGDWWKDTTDAGLPLISDMAPMGGTGANTTTTTDPALKTANSFNHNRDGQNVGFGDSHVEFARRPDCGQQFDNLFTFNGGTPSATGTAFTGGKAPNIANGGAPGNYDICLVPVADANANYTRK